MTTFSEPIRRHAGFFVCALALGIAPGPDNLFVLTQSLSQGAAAGILVMVTCLVGIPGLVIAYNRIYKKYKA